ncbi:MAG: phosphopantothenoylcysteine decarboxylase, partial [Candidatus Omnitrophica bacterium]|nr:phosphopantothenoylcysteine decarboxylase [Candidatus Omnitrophota bacterium]
NVLNLKLVKNEDILTKIGKRNGLVKIGFALETENPVKNGEAKLKNKKLDLVVINTKTEEENPFGAGKKNYIVISATGEKRDIKGKTKKEIAGIICGYADRLMRQKGSGKKALL